MVVRRSRLGRLARRARRAGRDERGATLIMALVFVFAIGLVLLALADLATGALLTTSNLRAQRTSGEDAATAVTIAVQATRYSYTPAVYAGTLTSCLPAGITVASSDARLATSNSVVVWCTGDVHPLSAATRDVRFYACPAGTAAAQCTGRAVLLFAEVTFDDRDTLGAASCNATAVASCGNAIDIARWDVSGADS